jgi:hypothetical protein
MNKFELMALLEDAEKMILALHANGDSVMIERQGRISAQLFVARVRLEHNLIDMEPTCASTASSSSEP